MNTFIIISNTEHKGTQKIVARHFITDQNTYLEANPRPHNFADLGNNALLFIQNICRTFVFLQYFLSLLGYL